MPGGAAAAARGPPLDAAGLDAWESAAWHTRQLGTVANDLGAGAALSKFMGCWSVPHLGICLTRMEERCLARGLSMHASSDCHKLASIAEDGAVTCLALRQCSAGVASRAGIEDHPASLAHLLWLCAHSVVSGADAAGSRAVSKRCC